MVGISKEAIRFILLEFERIAKTPRDVEVARTRSPSRFVKIKFTIKRTISVLRESIL